MTYRTVTSWGLIAGVSIADQRRMTPGMLCDLYVLRRRYDDEQHGIRRKSDDVDYSEADFDNLPDEETAKE